MSHDDPLGSRFEELRFDNEPPMASRPDDDLDRGRRHLRRRRAIGWSSGVAGLAAAATAVALAVPVLPFGGEAEPIQVTGNGPAFGQGSAEDATEDEDAGVDDDGPPSTDGDNGDFALPYPVTRQLLLDKAVEHFDPERTHLPDEPGSAGSRWSEGGHRLLDSKIGWTIPGETGEGMIIPAVSTPGYADTEYPYADWCAEDMANCVEQDVPEADGTVWLVESGHENDHFGMTFGVLHERPDGTLVAITINNLFGNNSEEPVSGIDIDLDQAIAFVLDPELHVDPDEADDDDDSGPGQAEPTQGPDEDPEFQDEDGDDQSDG